MSYRLTIAWLVAACLLLTLIAFSPSWALGRDPISVGSRNMPSGAQAVELADDTVSAVTSADSLKAVAFNDLDPQLEPVTGLLDPSFGGDGRVVTDLGSGWEWAYAVTMQTDGKIIVAGGADSGRQFAVARYATDGSLDTSFSGDGKTLLQFTSRPDYATALALQPDGKIVVVGASGWGGANPKIAIARLNSDGSLDTSFSGDGKLTTDITRKEDFANAVVVQTDGRIVVAGPSGVGGTSPKVSLVRFNTDGSLDRTFSSDGKVTTDFAPGSGDWVNGMALQADGKIVIAGCAGVGANWKFALARYDSDGRLDPTFSGDGTVTTNFTTTWDQAIAVAVQPDGKIVAAGIASQQRRDAKFALARYNTDGSLDTGFSGDGKVMTDFTGRKDYGECVAVQADGKIVVGGTAGWEGSNATFGLARYNSDGTLDATFSDDGKVRTDFTPRADLAFGILIQPDGRIVAAGESGNGGSHANIAIARYK